MFGCIWKWCVPERIISIWVGKMMIYYHMGRWGPTLFVDKLWYWMMYGIGIVADDWGSYILDIIWYNMDSSQAEWGCNGDMYCTHEYGLKPMGPIFWLGGRKSITTCTSYFGLDTQCSRVLTHTAGILVTSTTNEWPWKSCDQWLQNCLDFLSEIEGAQVEAACSSQTEKQCHKDMSQVVGQIFLFLRVGNPSSSIQNYPLVMTNIAIENDHRNSGFTHWKWCFSMVMLMLVYQRVPAISWAK